MNWFDFLVGVFLIIALFKGYQKGFIMQLVGLATIIIAAIFGGKLAQLILPELNRMIDTSPNIALALSYVLAFVAIALVVFLIGRVVQKFISVVQLSFINRVLGGVVALVSTMLVLSIVLNIVLILDVNETVIKKEIKESSFFFERVEAVVPAIVPYLNQEVLENVPEKYREEIERKSDSLLQFSPNPTKIDSTYQQRYFDID